MLFESFSTSFNATSWPTYLSMPCEVALKSVKKSFKNQIFPVLVQLLRHLQESIKTGEQLFASQKLLFFEVNIS
jgi:hypothetical protein